MQELCGQLAAAYRDSEKSINLLVQRECQEPVSWYDEGDSGRDLDIAQ